MQGAFSEEASNRLPEHGTSDMKIEFKEGQEPRNTGLRPMSPMELEELRKYLEENLGKGWIRRSKSPVSASIIFARKKDGSIRVCIDYRNLNQVTVKNRYPLPLILELTDRLVGATIFQNLIYDKLITGYAWQPDTSTKRHSRHATAFLNIW